MSTIAAVIVTFNRLTLLKELIESLQNQSGKLNAIIIVNNNSTDGTTEWLETQKDITVINQKNTGCSGGMYAGINKAYELGMEWIWAMDDDVECHKDCVFHLRHAINKYAGNYQIFQSNRYFLDESNPWRYGTKWNFLNPFKPECVNPVQVFSNDAEDCVSIASFPFEGPILHRKAVEQMGLPAEAFFINYDDTEYSLRAHRKRFKVGLLRDVILYKKIKVHDERLKPDFKLRFSVRNRIIINRMYGNPLITSIRASLDYIKTVVVIIKNNTYHQFGFSKKDIIVNVWKYTIEGFRFKI